MSGGVFDYIEIDQVLSSVKGDLGIADSGTIYDGNIERWINDSIPEVDACDFYVKKPVFLTLDDQKRAKIPPGYRRLLGMRFTSQTIEQVSEDGFDPTSCGDIMYMDMPFASDCGCRPTKSMADYMHTVEIVNGQFQFRNIPDGVEVVELSYMGVPVNGDCMYFIPAEYETASSLYARTMFYEAYPEVKGVQFSLAMHEKTYKRWKAKKSLLKAKAAKRNFDDNKYFIKTYFKAWFVRQNKTW